MFLLVKRNPRKMLKYWFVLFSCNLCGLPYFTAIEDNLLGIFWIVSKLASIGLHLHRSELMMFANYLPFTLFRCFDGCKNFSIVWDKLKCNQVQQPNFILKKWSSCYLFRYCSLQFFCNLSNGGFQKYSVESVFAYFSNFFTYFVLSKFWKPFFKPE